MPATVHITNHLGMPLEVCDVFGADFNPVDLIGATLRVTHASVDEIVFEIVSEGLPIPQGETS